jgi:hypothetical protein
LDERLLKSVLALLLFGYKGPKIVEGLDVALGVFELGEGGGIPSYQLLAIVNLLHLVLSFLNPFLDLRDLLVGLRRHCSL